MEEGLVADTPYVYEILLADGRVIQVARDVWEKTPKSNRRLLVAVREDER